MTPSVHLKELSIHHLQALVISTVGAQHEAEVFDSFLFFFVSRFSSFFSFLVFFWFRFVFCFVFLFLSCCFFFLFYDPTVIEPFNPSQIRQIRDKDHLLRLLTYLQKPQESNDGQLPRVCPSSHKLSPLSSSSLTNSLL